MTISSGRITVHSPESSYLVERLPDHIRALVQGFVKGGFAKDEGFSIHVDVGVDFGAALVFGKGDIVATIDIHGKANSVVVARAAGGHFASHTFDYTKTVDKTQFLVNVFNFIRYGI